MTRRRNSSPVGDFTKNLRDYAVPIMGILLVVFVLYSAFSGSDEELAGGETALSTNMTEDDGTTKMTLDFDTETSGFVEYSGGNKDKLSTKDTLYPGEKLIVEAGDVTLQDNSGIVMKLNRNGELAYDLNGDYLLGSSDLFVKSPEGMNVNLRFLTLNLTAGTIISLNQNEVASTVHVLAGEVNAQTFAGKQTRVKPGEKLSITSVETTQEDYKIETKVSDIGNYFFSETWAQENDLISYLVVPEEEANLTETGALEGEKKDPTKLITISGLIDNQTYETSSLNIDGELLDETVSKISFNGKIASINVVGKTYELKGFPIPFRENDIVYKAYDSTGNILERGVYTVYYSSGTEETTASKTEDFPVTDVNPQFSFTSPSPNPYTSNANFITIRGKATNGVAKKVTVNGLTLKSFNGNTWRYHASIDFGTLKNGVNLYKVNYFDAKGAILHTNTFTIIRKAPVAIPETQKTSEPEGDAISDSGGDTIGDRIPLD